jgi:hypothetical protein
VKKLGPVAIHAAVRSHISALVPQSLSVNTSSSECPVLDLLETSLRRVELDFVVARPCSYHVCRPAIGRCRRLNSQYGSIGLIEYVVLDINVFQGFAGKDQIRQAVVRIIVRG